MPVRAPEVEDFVRQWLDAKRRGDGSQIGAALSDYDGVLAIGTDADEWISGARAFADVHTAGGPFSATIEHVEAHREGDVAWAAVRAKVAWAESSLTVRLSLVLLRDERGGVGWRIVQSHASVAEAQ
jgi:ketosteroid isomerase-like protein